MLRERNMRAVGGGTEYRIRRVQPVAAGARRCTIRFAKYDFLLVFYIDLTRKACTVSEIIVAEVQNSTFFNSPLVFLRIIRDRRILRFPGLLRRAGSKNTDRGESRCCLSFRLFGQQVSKAQMNRLRHESRVA